jgi:hypothetical protein
MSLFDYPRINVKGTIQLNPGTANNDDYAGAVVLPDAWGPFAGETLALIDSKKVEARTYGMSDEAFIAWVQKAQTFDVKGSPGKTQQIIPAEWNYYGSMGSQIVSAQVIGVQTGPGTVYSQPDADVPLTDVLGAALTFSGHIADVNSEGSPPATQFFINGLKVANGDQTFLKGTPSKGACQWLNFYRNVNLTADGGAGGYVYHVIRKQPGTKIDLPGFDDPQIAGVIFRYYLYRVLIGTKDNTKIEELYAQQKTNTATLEIVGTFAPLMAGEMILTTPTGRLLVSNTAQIPTPQGTRNNGNGLIALGPAVLATNGTIVSADFSGTFPDYYQAGQSPENPKFDFGPVVLVVSGGGSTATIGPVEYANTDAGDQKGWVFDFDISSNPAAQQILSGGDAVFQLVHSGLGEVLAETDYYVVSNQQGIYGEQLGSSTQFVNQGTREPATVSVYRRGQELPAGSCPPITCWQYRSVPLQSPGDAEAIHTDLAPGQPIVVDTRQPGDFLFTFTINDAQSAPPAGYPPKSYSAFMNPPFITNAPSISLRILPNEEDFRMYYVNAHATEPVGNDLLTFDVVYQKVLRTYYLLYPAMNLIFPLNDEQQVSQNAQAILAATDPKIWMSIHYMPRTRDMSATRRDLLRAWCRKVLSASTGKTG